MDLGFDLFGVARAVMLDENGGVLKSWLDAGMNAGMEYMTRNNDKRINPDLLFPGTKSVIVTGLNYFTERKQREDVPQLSIYAYGKDYHDVILSRLDALLDYIGTLCPGSSGRAFVDSSSVLEKAWASRAGLGWQGKHSVLVNNKIGSFFFIGGIFSTVELEYDQPTSDRCGSCNLCIEACPTKAINDNRTVDARRCIAYLTIDNRVPVAEEDVEKLGGRIVGCDRCQEVCPWNSHAKPHNHPEFEISDELRNMTADDWLNLSKEDHERLFGNSAVKRRKYEVFIRNVTNVTKSIKGKNI